MLKINGVAIAAPKDFKVGISDVDGESDRNAQGNLMRDRIAVKKKLECEWGPLQTDEISVLLKAVRDVFFNVEYMDPEEGKFVIKTFYVGDRTTAVYSHDKATGKTLWKGLSMNFIER